MKKPTNPIAIGKIGSAYGILGWIKFFSFTEKQKKIFNYFPWFIFEKGEWKLIQVNKWKNYKNHFIIKIQNIFDRSQAKKLTNLEIFIDKNTLPKLKKNEYYWNDIIDCQVFDIKEKYLGKVINLIRNQNHDTLVIKQNNTKIMMIPFIYEKTILNINIEYKIIKVIWN